MQLLSENYQKLPELEALEERPVTVEELASKGRYLAVTTRSRVSNQDLWISGLADTTVEEIYIAQFFNAIVSTAASPQSTDKSSSEGKSQGSCKTAGGTETTSSSQTSISIETSSALDRALGKDEEKILMLYCGNNLRRKKTSVMSNQTQRKSFGVMAPRIFYRKRRTMTMCRMTGPLETMGSTSMTIGKKSELSIKIEENMPEDEDCEYHQTTNRDIRHPAWQARPRHGRPPPRSLSLDSSFNRSFVGSSASGSSDSERNEGGTHLEELLPIATITSPGWRYTTLRQEDPNSSSILLNEYRALYSARLPCSIPASHFWSGPLSVVSSFLQNIRQIHISQGPCNALHPEPVVCL